MAESSGGERAGLWLGLAVLFILVIADWVFGSFTRDLVRGHGELTVVSEPAGARVFADTLELGVTPLTDAEVPPGNYALRVEHAYSLPHRERVEIARGDVLQRSVTLEQAFGGMSLVSNPRGATVAIDGQQQTGETPLVIDSIAAGIHEVRLSLPNRRVVMEQVEVLPDRLAKLVVDLERLPLGKLEVATTPANARVEVFPVIDGEPAPNAVDYQPGATLPAQTYLVQVSRPGYEPQEQRLLLRRGANRLEFELTRITGQLTVTVEPADARVRVTAGARSFTYAGPTEVPVGDVLVRAQRKGFRARSRRIALDKSGATVTLLLPRFDVTIGRVFRDPLKSGGEGPELVVLGAGDFRMGDLSGAGGVDARPAHNVQLQAPFAIGVTEVTKAQWRARFGQPGDNTPIVKVTRDQIAQYVSWLESETGARYRLPSEAEWEYAARADSTSAYGTTGSLAELCRWANVADEALSKRYDRWEIVPCDDGAVRLAPVASFAANAFGLYDTVGNASEWVADCWHPDYRGAPADGRVWGQKCGAWVARGGAWDNAGEQVRISHRERVTREGGELGFRVVREL